MQKNVQEFYVLAGKNPVKIIPGNGSGAEKLTHPNLTFDKKSFLGGEIVLSNKSSDTGNSELIYYSPCDVIGQDSFEYSVGNKSENTAQQHLYTVYITVSANNVLAGHWKLDDSVGVTATDSTLFNHHGILTGGGSFDLRQKAYAAQYGRAKLLDGIDDHIKISSLGYHGNRITLTTWIKRDENSNDGSGIFFTGEDGGAGLKISGTSDLGYRWLGRYDNWKSGLIAPNHAWTFVALVIEPEKAILYMHDQTKLRYSINENPHPVQSFLGNLFIGWNPEDRNKHYRGAMDDIRFYNYPLNPAQIMLVYQGGIPDAPVPYNGATCVRDNVLRWSSGARKLDNQVYIGTSFEDMNIVTTESGEYRGITTKDEYCIESMTEGTQYYWRVDTITSTEILKGNIWSFTTSGNIE